MQNKRFESIDAVISGVRALRNSITVISMNYNV